MKAWEIRGGFGLENLVRTERPDPEPGTGEVLVEVKATSLNFRDWMMLKGEYNPRQPLPLVPLSDGAGVVRGVGPKVRRFKVGDRVTAIFAQRWMGGEVTRDSIRSSMGGPLDGMLSQYRALSEEGLVATPAHLSDEEAATLPCAAVTAWSAFAQRPLKPGETVLVQGTGGVALFALQFAKLAGARVLLISSSDAKLERAQRLGADAVLNYRTTPEWGQWAREETGGEGVHHVVEVGGAGTLKQSLRAVRINGQVSVIGVLGGSATETSLIPILMQNVRLQGVVVGSREDFEAMARARTLHGLHPVLDRTFDFEDVPAAFAHLASGAHFGKVCIRI